MPVTSYNCMLGSEEIFSLHNEIIGLDIYTEFAHKCIYIHMLYIYTCICICMLYIYIYNIHIKYFFETIS